MTVQPLFSWRAPRVFRTHRAAAGWAVDRNPYTPGTQAWHEWLLFYWRDQRDRGLAKADRAAKIALAAAIIAVAANIVNVVLATWRALG